MSATNSSSGVVFLDPLRHLRIDIMKQVGHGFLMDKVRWSRYFVAASEDPSALCDSVKMDLAEVDSKTRFFQALKRNWGKGDEPCNGVLGDALDFVNEAVADMMYDDISSVTHRISWALDGIEPHLFDNNMLRSSTNRWREEMGRWRNLLAKLDKELGDGPVQRSPELLGAREKVDRTSRRVETTFNALVGSNTLRLLGQRKKDESNSIAGKKVAIGGTWQGTFGNV
jgi:hypothetical protein